jgi:hypothetical protein
MTCPVCDASTNDHGIWFGNGVMRCLKCDTYFDIRSGELLYKGTSLTMGSHLRERIREKKDAESI